MLCYIWGTGHQAHELHERCAEWLTEKKILGYIDNDKKKKGQAFLGRLIYTPEILKEEKDIYIIIANIYIKEVTEQINSDYPWYSDRIIEVPFSEKSRMLRRYINSKDPEIIEVVNYLKHHMLQNFNYPYTEKYKKKNYAIEYDADKKLFYTIYYGKKMFFSRSFQNRQEVVDYYYSIEIEQDIQSPHRYLTDTFGVAAGSVVIDAGAAEGNFSLQIIDKVKKIYIFEPDDMWIEALNYTFEDYRDKVIIVPKYLSNYSDEKTVTIDETVGDEKVDFIKMDIEGEEYYAIQGAENVISASPNIRCVICTYHQEFAYQAIKQLLQEMKFSLETSRGYMWFPCHDARPAVLRRGVVRAKKDI